MAVNGPFHVPTALTPRKVSPVHFEEEDWYAPEPVRTL
jgi:hypothetical protein